MMDIPYYKQTTLSGCSVACIRMILAYFDILKTENEIKKVLKLKIEEGIDLGRIQRLFDGLDFESVYKYDLKRFEEAIESAKNCLDKGFLVILLVNRFVYDKETPLIGKRVFWENEKSSLHYVVLTCVGDEFIYINDPHEQIGRIKLREDVFARAWSRNLPWKFVFLAVKR